MILKDQLLHLTCFLYVISVRQVKLLQDNYKRANFNWLLTRIVDIPSLPRSFPIKFPEALIWEEGIPKYTITPYTTHLAMHPAKRLRLYLDTYFNKPLKRSKSTLCGRLTTNRTQEVKHKVTLRLKPFSMCIVNEKLMREIVTEWPQSALKKIQAIYRYVDDYDKDSAVIRVRYRQKKCEGVVPLAKQCADALITLLTLLKLHSNVDVVEINAEFFVSKQGYLLHNAWGIVYKNPTKHAYNRECEEAANKRWEAQLKLDLFRRLKQSERKKEFIKSLRGLISNHVQSIKQEVGLPTALKDKVVSKRSEETFKRLHPYSQLNFLQTLNINTRHKFSKKRQLHTRSTCDITCVMNKSWRRMLIKDRSVLKKSLSRVNIRRSTMQISKSRSVKTIESKSTFYHNLLAH